MVLCTKDTGIMCRSSKLHLACSKRCFTKQFAGLPKSFRHLLLELGGKALNGSQVCLIHPSASLVFKKGEAVENLEFILFILWDG